MSLLDIKPSKTAHRAAVISSLPLTVGLVAYRRAGAVALLITLVVAIGVVINFWLTGRFDHLGN